MWKKVIRLNLDDLYLCLGAVAGVFLLIQLVTAGILAFTGEHSSIMISGVVLPIVAGIMTLIVGVAAVSVSFEQALRFGQTRRRAIFQELVRSLFMGGCSMALAALLTALERLVCPVLWLALSRAERLVWGEVPPLPAVWEGTDQGWRELLDEISSTL